MPSNQELLQVLQKVCSGLDRDLSLESMAARAGWSPFHFHRAFRQAVHETPKQYVSRLRLERAAARLVASDASVIDTAIAGGFQSHEVFTRAFRRRFGRSPSDYRRIALMKASQAERARHLAETDAAGPCIGLYRCHTTPRGTVMPMLSVERQEIPQRHVLFVRRKTTPAEIPNTLADCYGKVFGHCHVAGLAIAGRPYTRYVSMGPGSWTIEAGVPIAAAAPGGGEIEAGTLPGGPSAIAIHGGPYDQLGETYSALEKWIEANKLRPNGAPWEFYITDPADHPDTTEWRTEVIWPVAAAV